MKFGTIAVGTHRTHNVRTMVVVDACHPVASHVELFALFIGLSFIGAADRLRVAITGRSVLTCHMSCVEAVAGQFGMLLKKSTGVHDADHGILAMEPKRIGLGCIHCCQAPVLLVFRSFP